MSLVDYLGADLLTAFESFQPMYQIASQTLLDNGFDQSSVELVPRCSKDVKRSELSLKDGVKLIVAEIFDTELIGEGCLSTFIHAKKELLNTYKQSDDYKFVPHSAKVFVIPFQSKFIRKFLRIERAFGESYFGSYFKNVQSCSGLASPLELQFTHLLESDYLKDDFIELSKPIEVFDFNFSNLSEENLEESKEIDIPCTNSGSIDGMLFYWKLFMNDDSEENDIDSIISTSPFKESFRDLKAPWREHWMQAVFCPKNAIKVEKGKHIKLKCNHDEYNFWFDINSFSEPEKLTDNEINPPSCFCGVHICLNRNRFLLANDIDYFEKYRKALLTYNLSSKTVLLVGNFNLLLDLILSLKPAKLLIYEENTLCLKTLRKIIKCNSIPNIEVEFLQILPQTFEVDFIIGEPYFMSSELPWHNVLTFRQIVKFVQKNSSQPFRVIPSKAVLKCALGRTTNLHKIREPISGSIHGINLQAFNQVMTKVSKSAFANVESHRLFQYETFLHTKPKTIHEFDLSSEENEESWIYQFDLKNILSEKKNRCVSNCLFLWMEYELISSQTGGDCECKNVVISEGLLDQLNQGDNFDDRNQTDKITNWNPVYKQAVSWFDSNSTQNIQIEYFYDTNEINIKLEK